MKPLSCEIGAAEASQWVTDGLSEPRTQKDEECCPRIFGVLSSGNPPDTFEDFLLMPIVVCTSS